MLVVLALQGVNNASEEFLSDAWDAWPVSQDWSDARKATNFNKVSHSNLTHIQWKPYVKNSKKRTWLMMTGMTDKSAGELVPIARSWLKAPELKLKSGNVTSRGYDKPQRAYIMSCKEKAQPDMVEFQLKASSESPIVNAAFIIKDWGYSGASITVNDSKIPCGKDFRLGHRDRMDGADLIIWVKYQSQANTDFVIEPVE